jgi:hypothetical protein
VAVLTLTVLASFTSQSAAANAKDRPAGLMWNRTGLPAVFPLQVKTSAGRDYVVTLYDAETGEAALAAFIKGGVLFKVLVPPGVFTVSFATGETWWGEEELFGLGAATQVFTLAEPLTFGIRDAGIKAGHMVDISENPSGLDSDIAVKDQLICQSLRVEFSRTRDVDPRSDYFDPKPDEIGTYRLEVRRSVYSQYCG